jgi:hypothetical protein
MLAFTLASAQGAALLQEAEGGFIQLEDDAVMAYHTEQVS